MDEDEWEELPPITEDTCRLCGTKIRIRAGDVIFRHDLTGGYRCPTLATS